MYPHGEMVKGIKKYPEISMGLSGENLLNHKGWTCYVNSKSRNEGLESIVGYL